MFLNEGGSGDCCWVCEYVRWKRRVLSVEGFLCDPSAFLCLFFLCSSAQAVLIYGRLASKTTQQPSPSHEQKERGLSKKAEDRRRGGR